MQLDHNIKLRAINMAKLRRLSKKETFKLIELVQQNTPIIDICSENYKDRESMYIRVAQSNLRRLLRIVSNAATTELEIIFPVSLNFKKSD